MSSAHSSPMRSTRRAFVVDVFGLGGVVAEIFRHRRGFFQAATDQ